jgi:hypothetical protein
MQCHREPLAATLAALAVFIGIVAPALMLILALSLTAAGLAMLALADGPGSRTDDRQRMQNPR